MTTRHGAATLLVAAILGGGVTSGILAATGNLGDGGSSGGTVIEQASASGGSATSTSSGDVSGLYADASPAVVQITSKGGAQSSSSGPFPQSGRSQTATGTGFVIDEQGDILTAAHVVDGGSEITVTLQDGTTKTATVA